MFVKNSVYREIVLIENLLKSQMNTFTASHIDSQMDGQYLCPFNFCFTLQFF